MTPPQESYTEQERPLGTIVELRRTCLACPAQWEGRDDDGRWLYIRYRHGRLSWGTGLDQETAVKASMDDPAGCYEAGIGGRIELPKRAGDGIIEAAVAKGWLLECAVVRGWDV